MRTIKFRIFNKKIKSYIDIHSSAIMIDELNDLNEHLIVEQFTGLRDKNGKEIYEGDLIDFGNSNPVEVKFDNGCFNVFNEPLGWDFDSEEIPIKTNLKYCEVLGNIYENPELLDKNLAD